MFLIPYSNLGLDRFKTGDVVHINMMDYLASDKWDYQHENNVILNVTPCYVRFRTPGHERRVRRCSVYSITPAVHERNVAVNRCDVE